MRFHYCVNTFQEGEPVQLSGLIVASDEWDVVRKLIQDDKTIYPKAYEFLELKPIS